MRERDNMIRSISPIANKVGDAEEDILEKAVKEVAKVEKTTSYVVKPMRLNVRKEPSETATVVGTVIGGDILTVQETTSINPSWKRVTAPVNGYVVAAYVEPKR